MRIKTLPILAAVLACGLATAASAVTLNLAENNRILTGNLVKVAGTNTSSGITADANLANLNGSTTTAGANLNSFNGNTDFTTGDVVNVYGRLNATGIDPFQITFDTAFRVVLEDIGLPQGGGQGIIFRQDGTTIATFSLNQGGVADTSTPNTVAATIAAGTYVFSSQGNGGDRMDYDLSFTGLAADVPIPASLALFLGALGLMGVVRRRPA